MLDVVDKIFSKINSYNLFNYLFPGVIFFYLLKHYSTISLKEEPIFLIATFLLYFTGIVLSRIRSIIKPFLKKIKVIKFASYKDYVKVENFDKKLSLLCEVNNTYIFIISTFLIFYILKL